MTVRLIGNDDLASGSHTIGNIVHYQKFQAIETGMLTGIQTEGIHDGEAMVALYSDGSGNPGSLLTSSSSVEFLHGIVTIPVNTPVVITSGMYYWLAIATPGATIASRSGTGFVVRYKMAMYSSFTFPNPPTSLTSETTYTYQLSGWGDPVGRSFQVIIL
jgi:hypothetical protein